MRVSYALEGRIFVETGANTREITKGRRGKALDQKGQPYSKEFYESWRERKNNYDSSSALKDFKELLEDAARCGNLSELLVAAQEWFFDLRESLRESDVAPARA